MSSNLFFRTQSSNIYQFSFRENIIMFTHPLLYVISNTIHTFGEDKVKIPEKISIENVEYFKDEIEYYYEKYKLLKKNGFVDSHLMFDNYNRKISPDEIIYSLSNLSQVVFEVTDSCNLKCKYCTYGDFYCDFDRRENNHMSFSTAKIILDYLILQWKSSFNTSVNNIVHIGFYGGEPLLNIELIKDVINYLENQDLPTISFRWMMTTNAVLLDKHMDFLVEKNFSILISLDGNESNNSYRITKNNKNSHKLAYENANKLRLKHPDFFKINVNFNSVLHNRNSVEDIITFFKNSFNKVPNIGELNSSGIRAELKEDFLRIYKNASESLQLVNDYEDFVAEMDWVNPDLKKLTIFLHNYSGNVYRSYSDLLTEKQNYKYTNTGTCLPFGKKLFLTVTGKIIACERIGHHFSLGRIHDGRVELNIDEIARKHNYYLNKVSILCSKCYRINSCTQCVFNLETIEDKKTTCAGFTGPDEFLRYLSSNISFLESHPLFYEKVMSEIIVS
jgi:uncharacterized protein